MKQIKEILSSTNVAEAVIANDNLLLLFEHFGISIPVQSLNFGQLSKLYNIREELLLAFANLYNGKTSIGEIEFDAEDAEAIIKFIKTSHSFYAKQLFPEAQELINQMEELNTLREMKLVPMFFSDYFKEVLSHFDYENNTFHPYVQHLIESIKNNTNHEFGELYSVNDYQDNHDDIEDKLIDLKRLLVKYLPVDKDINVRRKLLMLLTQIQYDLKIHSYIEELILMPLTAKLEKQVNSGKQ